MKYIIPLLILIPILLYKYLLRKKSCEYSKTDALFLVVVFLILLFPIFNINPYYVSHIENRVIAKYPIFIYENGRINENFGREFENYILDRFTHRENVIKFHNCLKYYITKRYLITKNAYLDKKTKWCFEMPVVAPKFSDFKTKNTIEGLKSLNTELAKNNVKFYIIVVPNKNDVYSYNTFVKKEEIENHGEIIQKFRDETNIPIIYPYKEFRTESKIKQLYYKTDHHWTHYGAYLGYKALMKEMKKDFSDIKEVSLDDFYITKNNYLWDGKSSGMTIKLQGLSDKITESYLDTQYEYYHHKDQKTVKYSNKNTVYRDLHRHLYSKGADYKVYMTGTSMGFALSDILKYTFKELDFYYCKWESLPIPIIIENFQKDITKSSKPDIFILCVTVDNLKKLQ